MSLVVSTQPTDGLWASVYAGFGIRGGDVPGTGTHGGSPVRDDLAFPADADLELTWQIVSPPPTGTLSTGEDLTYSYTPPGGTVNLYTSFTYRVRGDGAVLYDDVEAIVIGTPTNILGVTGAITETVTGVVAGDVTIAAAAPTLQVTGTIVDAPDGIVSGTVTIAAAAAPEELLITGAVLGDAEGVVAGSVTVGSGEDPVPVLDAGLRSIRAGRLVPQKLAPLDVAEADNLTADMGTVLAGDDPIVDVLLTSEDRVGDDGTENPLLFGDWQVQGHLVRQRIVGWRGLIGVTYLIRVQATAQSGKVAVATAFVKVVRLA
ncbi:MAG: hypothetical protein RJA10_49 [Pseudomonadota bacterium]|jgi:hypothetical protein